MLVAAVRRFLAQIVPQPGGSPHGSDEVQIPRAFRVNDSRLFQPVQEAARKRKPVLQCLQPFRCNIYGGPQRVTLQLSKVTMQTSRRVQTEQVAVACKPTRSTQKSLLNNGCVGGGDGESR